MRIAGSLILTALVVVLAAPGWAVTHPEAPPVGEVLIPYYDVGGVFELYLQRGSRSLEEGSTLRRRLGGGQWQYQWNKLTGTLHDVYGDALRLSPGPLTVQEQVDRVARTFIDANVDLLGARAGELALDQIDHGNGKWYIRYRQVVDGLPVYKAYLRLQITDDGRLIRLGSDFHPFLQVPAGSASLSDAEQAAVRGLDFDPARDRIEDRGLMLLPSPAPGQDETAVRYQLVRDLVVSSAAYDGPYEIFVDVASGEIARRDYDVHFVDLTGTVTGDADYFSPCDPPVQTFGFQDLKVTVTDVGFTHTDDNGDYLIDVPDGLPHPVEMQLKGLHARVVNADGPDAVVNATGTPGTPLDVHWTDANSGLEERDCFYHENRIYDYVKNIIGTTSLFSLEGSVPCNVNMTGTCNAFYSNATINFYKEGGGCRNTALVGDVIYHEYGHGLDQFMGAFSPPVLSEGIADIWATVLTDDNRIGHGFYLASCNLLVRNCNNNLHYPQDLTGETHQDGRIICGFNWDVYQNYQTAGVPDTHRDTLQAFTLYATPQTQPEYVTQWFIEDDDDGILNNGTPTYDQLCDAALQHGYSCPELFEGVIVNHTPIGDTNNTTDPYEIVAVIGTTHTSIDSAFVFYSLDMGPMTPVQMTPTGNPSEYTASIPAQPAGSLIRYYVLGSDNVGFRATSPDGAPGIAHSVVVAATLSEHLRWDMESDAGWVVGDVPPAFPDDATAGIWERSDPVQVVVFIGGYPTPATPEDDTTPDPGVNCWHTELDDVGGQAGSHDVDGGKTTLRSAVFDISSVQFARLRYDRWFTNALGNNKSEDPFQVGLSTNGGLSYTTIEETLISASAWTETLVDLNGFVPFGNNMRLRFVARDQETGEFGPSIVEAAVDEVTIVKWPPESQAVDDPPLAGGVPLRFNLRQNNPNPFNPTTAIDYAVAARGRVELKIFNVYGQLVRTLVDAAVEAGQYSVTWDGRDDQGSQVASGAGWGGGGPRPPPQPRLFTTLPCGTGGRRDASNPGDRCSLPRAIRRFAPMALCCPAGEPDNRSKETLGAAGR